MSLFSKVGKLLKPLAPMISALPIPGAAAIGAVVNAGMQARAMSQSLMGSAPVPAPVPPGGGMVQTAGALGPALQAGSRWLISATGVVRTLAGKILGVMRGTKLFRNRKVAQLAKQVGLGGAATVLGIAVVDVAEMITQHHVDQGTRKRRGISYRDVAITRRTIGKIASVQANLSKAGICRPRRYAKRST